MSVPFLFLLYHYPFQFSPQFQPQKALSCEQSISTHSSPCFLLLLLFQLNEARKVLDAMTEHLRMRNSPEARTSMTSADENVTSPAESSPPPLALHAHSKSSISSVSTVVSSECTVHVPARCDFTVHLLLESGGELIRLVYIRVYTT